MKKLLFTIYFIVLAIFVIWNFHFPEWTLNTYALRETAVVFSWFLIFSLIPVLLYIFVNKNRRLVASVAIAFFFFASCNSYFSVGKQIDANAQLRDVKVLKRINDGQKLIIEESFNGKTNTIDQRRCIVQDVWIFRKYIKIGEFESVRHHSFRQLALASNKGPAEVYCTTI